MTERKEQTCDNGGAVTTPVTEPNQADNPTRDVIALSGSPCCASGFRMLSRNGVSGDETIARHQIIMRRKMAINKASNKVFQVFTLGMFGHLRFSFFSVEKNNDAINLRVRELRVKTPSCDGKI